MNDSLANNLSAWLGETGLPEPELEYPLNLGSRHVSLALAFPDHRLGLLLGEPEQTVVTAGEWTIWRCENIHDARSALWAMAERLGLKPRAVRLDFGRLQALLAAGQLGLAREELQKLQSLIGPSHPDWTTCEELGRTLRKAEREARRGQGQQLPDTQLPVVSAAKLFQHDGARLQTKDLPAHTLLGLYTSSEQGEMSAIDAVWVANVGAERTDVWTATVTGNPAYASDATWEVLATEAELLTGLLRRLQAGATLVWDAAQVWAPFEAWYQRTTGNRPPDAIRFMDLRALCLVAFPTAQRIDRPESLCQELNLAFRDAAGLGGPLAAMEALLQHTARTTTEMDDPLRAALREVLEKTGMSRAWLDALLPPSASRGFVPYLHGLGDHFAQLPPPIQSSTGQKALPNLTGDQFFGEGGLLAKVVGPSYRLRQAQQDFALEVEKATQSDAPFVLEAGTGVGKTIGYLVPLLLSGKRCFVATHTKNLQDQAWTKDVPTALRALTVAGLGRTVSILKGKNNYVCLQTIAEWLDDLDELVETPQEALVLAGLLTWLTTTQTGWFSEVESLGPLAFLERLGRHQAPPALSEPWASIDPHSRAKEAAETVDVVLVNHSWVIAMAQGPSQSESGAEVLLFDEAHNLEDVATEALSLHFVPWSLQSEIDSLLKRDDRNRITGLLRPVVEHVDADRIRELGNFRSTLFSLEQTLKQWCHLASERLAEMCEGVSDYDPDTPVLFSMDDFWVPSVYDPAQVLRSQLVNLGLAIEALLERLPGLSIPTRRRLPGSLGTLLEHIQENAEALAEVLTPDVVDRVRWAEARVRMDRDDLPMISESRPLWWAVFHSTPLDVAAWLQETLYPLYPHRLYVSATMTVGASFTSMIDRLGLQSGEDGPEPVTHVFPSPFNFREQVLLAVPSDAPYPGASTDALYVEGLSVRIAELARAASGRTLVLFTSRRTMREVAARLQARLKDQGVAVLQQSASNRAALIERFRSAPDEGERLVLLGLRAFWEGVDVPGAALSLLVISRLPFDYAGHPVALARQKHYLSQGPDRDYFRDVVVPATFLHLRQMYGRLIRKEDDRGVCVVMDPRVYVKRYGKQLLRNLPASAKIVARSPDIIPQVERFLRDGTIPPESFEWGELPTIPLDLSPEQGAIVECPAQRILVRAAAGSGKTHVLTARLIRVVEAGRAQPEQILALTYTRKAQNVMADRVWEQLPEKAAAMERNILTYHRFAARILRYDDQGTGQQTAFLDETDPTAQSELFQHARERAGLQPNELPDEDAATVAAYAQNGLVDEEELQRELPGLENADPYTAKLARFFLAYVEQLRAKHLVDYGEAIVRAVRILREDPNARQMWSGRFRWIFCDEYQDTTPAQATLLSLIGQHANLFVVGDSAQSIYSWQGADPENLRRFEIDFPNTATFPLNRNYRCFPNLVLVSGRFLERCGQTHGIHVTYDDRRSTERQSVYYLASSTDREEANAIAVVAAEALKLEIPGTPPRTGTVGILARTWALLGALELELIKQEVPYRFEGETARGLTAPTDIRRILQRAVDLLAWAGTDRQVGHSPDGRVVDDLRKGRLTLADQVLDRARQAMGLNPLPADVLRNYQNLSAALRGKPGSLLQRLYGRNETQPVVVLSTVHSQKGEEFDTVFVVGLERDNLPHKPPVRHVQIVQWRRVVQRLSHATWRTPLGSEDSERLYEEEEQRIFYVAMTRARHNLVVSHADRRERKAYEESEFLDRAKIQVAVQEAKGAYDIHLAEPQPRASEAAYRSDGRMYQTNAGILVRSKSEMLLANEFTRRGMYFEYEEPAEGVPYALPDFTFPDYGRVILEHLGLMAEADYAERWAEKAAKYEAEGIRYFRTNETEIEILSTTVDRLQAQFRTYAGDRYGRDRVRCIELVERTRQAYPDLSVTYPVDEFERGIFAAEDRSAPAIVGIAVTVVDGVPWVDPASLAGMTVLSNTDVEWTEEPRAGVRIHVARVTKG